MISQNITDIIPQFIRVTSKFYGNIHLNAARIDFIGDLNNVEGFSSLIVTGNEDVIYIKETRDEIITKIKNLALPSYNKK